MARGQNNSTIILLGLKDYKVGEVVEGVKREVVKTSAKGEEKKCPHRGSARLCRHGTCKPRKVLHTWSNGRRVYLEFGICFYSCPVQYLIHL